MRQSCLVVCPSCPAFLPVWGQGQLDETLVGRHHSPRLPQTRVTWWLVIYEGCWEPEYGLSCVWKGQSLELNLDPLSVCVFINLEACLFLSELSGLASSLELGGEAQEGLQS